MRSRFAPLLACALAAAGPRAAVASWPPGGVLLERPRPAGENGLHGLGADGVGGTYVLWSERDEFGEYAFRVHRLDVDGNTHAGWTGAGVRVLSPVGFTKTPLLVADLAGGTYVVWPAVDSTARVSRIGPDGSLSPGWPADGLPVSTLGKQIGVVATADGTGGVLVAWTRVLNNAPSDIVTQRFQAGGTRAPAFPAAGRVLTTFDYQRGRFHPQLIRDPGHGFWVSFHAVEIDASFPASAYAVLHLGVDGILSAGQPANGLKLSLPYGEIGTLAPYVPVALALDGAGGVIAFTLGGNGNVRAFHVLDSVSEDPTWPAGGTLLAVGASWPSLHFDDGDENWPVAAGDLAGGAWVGWRNPESLMLHASRVRADGSVAPGWSSPVVIGGGMQITLLGDASGVYASAHAPIGCPQFDCYGPVLVSRMNLDGTVAAGWPASNPPYVDAPGIALGLAAFPFRPSLVADGVGGVVVAWSQYPDYYAMRFTSAGELAGVPPGPAGPIGVRARFDRATGVHVWCSTGGAAEGVVELFDLVGRRLASAPVHEGASEMTLSGTRRLGAGLYLARLTTASGGAVAKVVATR